MLGSSCVLLLAQARLPSSSALGNHAARISAAQISLRDLYTGNIFSLYGRDGSVNEISKGLRCSALEPWDAVWRCLLRSCPLQSSPGVNIMQHSASPSFLLSLLHVPSLDFLAYFFRSYFFGVRICSPGFRREAAAGPGKLRPLWARDSSSSSAPLLSLWPLVTQPLIGQINWRFSSTTNQRLW